MRVPLFNAGCGGDLRIAGNERKVKCDGGRCDQAVAAFRNRVETLGLDERVATARNDNLPAAVACDGWEQRKKSLTSPKPSLQEQHA